MSVNQCKLIQFKKIADARGAVTPIEAEQDIPFAIKRVYYLYDVAPSMVRGAHAHKALEQVLVAVHGSFEIEIDDGKKKQLFQLQRPDIGLYLPNMIWRELKNFSDKAVCLVLASEHYDERDYYRDYDQFIQAI